MIYTIGYANVSIEDVERIMSEKRIAFLIDVRSHPYTRRSDKFAFNRNRLEERLGASYLWLGGLLGGKNGPVKDSGIDSLIKIAYGNGPVDVLIMCAEAHPCDCHRYYEIGLKLALRGVQAAHLFDGAELTTSELKEVCDARKKGR